MGRSCVPRLRTHADSGDASRTVDPVTDTLTCLVAHNPSPLTLEGTNTWIWAGHNGCVIVDPGPEDPVHLEAILAHVCERPITAIVLTHDHEDHSGNADALSQASGTPISSARTQTLPAGELAVLGTQSSRVRVVPLPGHTADSVGIIFVQEKTIATGDTIFAYGSAMIDWPDGSLESYLSSLVRLRTIIIDYGLTSIIPGHGSVIDDPLSQIDLYYQHRLDRLQQVSQVMDQPLDSIVSAVYGDLGFELRDAARRTIQAQLEYLRSSGMSGTSPPDTVGHKSMPPI